MDENPIPQAKKRFIIPTLSEVDSVRSETLNSSNFFKKRILCAPNVSTTNVTTSTTITASNTSAKFSYNNTTDIADKPNTTNTPSTASNISVSSNTKSGQSFTKASVVGAAPYRTHGATFGEAFAFVKSDPLYSPPPASVNNNRYAPVEYTIL